ncbi:MAG: SDR family oxidoreductase [Ignavibacteriae bacterium]|nr:SDR family oxidoreductase [Ignavibacteria bacterium]MBI3365126.1 SDR family oxidoreductase [Ignavibacteriota bacterium]
MNILITGGAGYIGSILVERLLLNNLLVSRGMNELALNGTGVLDNPPFHLKEKIKVTVVDNLLYKQTNLTQFTWRDDFNYVYGDVRDRNLMTKLLLENDVIIPLAAIVGMPACKKFPSETLETNQKCIEWLAENSSRDQLIVYPTTNSGYGIGQVKGGDLVECTEETPLNPISLYGTTKVNAENALLNNNKGNAITLRLATAFGISPRMRLDILVNDFTYRAYTDRYMVIFEGHFKRNFIHVRDIARTFIYCVNKAEKMKGQTFNVGLSDANLSKLELCARIRAFIPDFYVTQSEINKDPDQRNYIVSNKKLESLDPKEPWFAAHSLDSGIKELIKAYSIISNNNRKFTNL